jgi:hypothetical protein
VLFPNTLVLIRASDWGVAPNHFGATLVLQSECPITLKGTGFRTTPECDSTSPVVLQHQHPITLKGVGIPLGSNVMSDRAVCSNPTSSTVEMSRRDDPEGRPGRGITPRVVRIRSDGSVHLKPVEVNPLRHAFSWLSGLGKRTHDIPGRQLTPRARESPMLARAVDDQERETCPCSDMKCRAVGSRSPHSVRTHAWSGTGELPRTCR